MGSQRRNVMHPVLIILLHILTIIAVHGDRKHIKIEKAPYQVMVLYSNGNSREHGGGAIISNDWIVTAAHVCMDTNLERYKIIAGTRVWFSGGSKHELAEIIIHPDYTKKSDGLSTHDIALIKVKEPFVLDKTRQIIQLNKKPMSEIVGRTGTVTGWPGDDNYLSRAYCNSLSSNECRQYLNIPDDVFCSNYCADDAELESGDSGDPFVVSSKLVGILSQGTFCLKDASAICFSSFTDISDHVKWIDRYVTLQYGLNNELYYQMQPDNHNVKVTLKITT